MIRYQVVNVKCMKRNSHDVIKVLFPALAAAGNFQDLLKLSLVPVLRQIELPSPGLEDLPDGHDPPCVRIAVVIHRVHI